MKVTQYSTNSYGEFVPYELKPALRLGGAYIVEPVEAMGNKGFLGFGVAITGASCYNLYQMPKEKRRAFLESIYGENGLGFKVARLTIGASDYSAELYTYDDVENDMDLAHFSIERDKEYIIPVIKEILDINPKLRIYAAPWTPPAWMKTGNSVGGGHMRHKYVECYAEYFVKYLKAYEEEGIHIFAVNAQNEPETQQNGMMPACIWNPDTEAAFIMALRKKLKENHMDTEIWMNDHSFVYCEKVEWMLEEYPQLQEDCDAIAFHYYDGNIEQTTYLKEKYPDLKLHFTEGGPRLYDHYDTDWCKWVTMMCKTLNNGYTSFAGWNLMLDETGGPNVGPFFCGGLATRNRATGELSYSGQYKAFKHVANYVREDSVIRPVVFQKQNSSMSNYYGDGKALTGSEIENADGSKTLLLVNPNTYKAQVQYLCNGTWWYIELMPETVSTVCFEI